LRIQGGASRTWRAQRRVTDPAPGFQILRSLRLVETFGALAMPRLRPGAFSIALSAGKPR
jgi:hypothetical protein